MHIHVYYWRIFWLSSPLRTIHYFSFFLSLSLTLFLYLCLWSFMRSGMGITHYIGLACALKNFLSLSLFNISVLFLFFLPFFLLKLRYFSPNLFMPSPCVLCVHYLYLPIMFSWPIFGRQISLPRERFIYLSNFITIITIRLSIIAFVLIRRKKIVYQ